MRAWLTSAGTTLALTLVLTSAEAADLFERQRSFERGIAGPLVEEEPELAPLPRFFPREGGEAEPVIVPRARRIVRSCRPRRAPVPTDAPDDPSYVGSTYGLGKPSYYGFVPGLGTDDPFGRPVLPYCR